MTRLSAIVRAVFRQAARPVKLGEVSSASGNSSRRKADRYAVLRRILSLAIVFTVLLALLSTGAAVAQESTDDEEAAEPASYGDAELIETLTRYGLIDEWLAASRRDLPQD